MTPTPLTSKNPFERIEAKLDRLNEAVKLLISELDRQTTQTETLNIHVLTLVNLNVELVGNIKILSELLNPKQQPNL